MEKKDKENEFQRAMEISQSAAELGFDFEDYHGPVDKIREEVLELIEVLEGPEVEKHKKAGEFGDLLFSVLNLARKIGVDPQSALRLTNEKFLSRFTYVEAKIKSHGPVPLEEMERWWTEAKENESP